MPPNGFSLEKSSMTDKTSAPREVTFLPPLRMPLTFAARTVDLRQPEQRAEEHKTRIDEKSLSKLIEKLRKKEE